MTPLLFSIGVPVLSSGLLFLLLYFKFEDDWRRLLIAILGGVLIGFFTL